MSDGKPEVNHLALVVNMAGNVIAIPPGAMMLLVDGDTTMPLRLESVAKTELAFACGCGVKACTRRITMKVRYTGHHPNKNAN